MNTQKTKKLESLITEYLKGAQNLQKDLLSWHIAPKEAQKHERNAHQLFMDDVYTHGLDPEEAEELWNEVVIGIGVWELADE